MPTLTSANDNNATIASELFDQLCDNFLPS
jgi:hypothetical protein